MQFAACSSLLPEAVCRHQAALLVSLAYLLPSALLALLIRALAARYPIFFFFQLAGTICHECSHFVAGLMTGARPASFSIVPQRVGRGWQLGAVKLANVRWYNAAPAALAPFAVALIPFVVALWRTRFGWRFEGLDAGLAFLLAPQFLSWWPSAEDWKIALRSWPYSLLAAGAWWMFKCWH